MWNLVCTIMLCKDLCKDIFVLLFFESDKKVWGSTKKNKYLLAI
jgi:hypothetical protein